MKVRTIKPVHEAQPPAASREGYGSMEGQLPGRASSGWSKPSSLGSEIDEVYIWAMGAAVSVGLVIGALLGMIYLLS